MQVQTPSTVSNQDEYNKSVNRALSGNISPGNGNGTEDSAGQPLTFTTDNTVGRIIRVGSTANPNGLPNSWPASNTNLTIEHDLNAVPYGYIVIAKSGPCDVYWGTVAATATFITLKNTDATQDTTIWLLC